MLVPVLFNDQRKHPTFRRGEGKSTSTSSPHSQRCAGRLSVTAGTWTSFRGTCSSARRTFQAVTASARVHRGRPSPPSATTRPACSVTSFACVPYSQGTDGRVREVVVLCREGDAAQQVLVRGSTRARRRSSTPRTRLQGDAPHDVVLGRVIKISTGTRTLPRCVLRWCELGGRLMR